MQNAKPASKSRERKKLESEIAQIKRRELAAAEAKVEALANGQATAPYDTILTRLAAQRNEAAKRLEG